MSVACREPGSQLRRRVFFLKYVIGTKMIFTFYAMI